MDSKSLHQMIQLVETKLGLKSHALSLLIWNDRIKERMAACRLSSYEEYHQLLLASSQEMQELIELIVNLETWFFREKGAFDYLMHIVKQAKFWTPFFKILSFACSTGEEPYSIAMTLFDAGLSKTDFRIDAFDMSRRALIRARHGIYGENSFRSQDLSFRERYFNSTNGSYAIKNKVKKQVVFYEALLLDEQNIIPLHSYHVIFCRNLLIYLNQAAQIDLLNRLKRLMVFQGILIVGSAETKIARKAGFEPFLFPGANAFKISNREIDKKEKRDDSTYQRSQSTSIHEKRDIYALSGSNLEFLTLPPLSGDEKGILLQEIMKKANAGIVEEAKQLCLHYLHLYGANPDIYYILGLIYHAEGSEGDVEKCFHKAIYLKPSHYEALICLALLYEGQGKWKEAELLRKRALKYTASS